MVTSHCDVWAARMSRAPGRFGLHREGGMRHVGPKPKALPAKGESRGAGGERKKRVGERSGGRGTERLKKKKKEKKPHSDSHTHTKEALCQC